MFVSTVKPTRCTTVSNLFYFAMTLYMFWTVFPSIISSSRLYIQQHAFVKQILPTATKQAVGIISRNNIKMHDPMNVELIHFCKLLVVKLLKLLVAACYDCDSQFLVWEVKKITKCNDEDDNIYEDSGIRDFQGGYRSG